MEVQQQVKISFNFTNVDSQEKVTNNNCIKTNACASFTIGHFIVKVLQFIVKSAFTYSYTIRLDSTHTTPLILSLLKHVCTIALGFRVAWSCTSEIRFDYSNLKKLFNILNMLIAPKTSCLQHWLQYYSRNGTKPTHLYF